MTGTRSETGLTATTGALAGVAAVLLVVLGVVAVQQGLGSDDPDPASADPATSTTMTESASSSSSTPSESPAATEEPQDEAWLKEAVRAAKDQFPAFVPSTVPSGWTVDSAVYAKEGTWRMELTSSAGRPVTVDQRDGDDVMPGVTEAVGKDAERTGSVNLRRWGTGTWALYEGDGRLALAQGLANTAVVVSGDDKADVVRLTKQLLTAEMVVNVGDGSDG